MGKIMALVEDNVVVNIMWCSDDQEETDVIKDPGDRLISIGDTYEDGTWYREDGIEILTPLEEAQKKILDLQSQITEMDESYRQGVNSV